MKHTTLLLITAAALIACAPQNTPPEIGDKAPVFQAVDDQGNAWKSEDHTGEKYIVLYFYPAAMTSGCTRQACAYPDFSEDLSGLNAAVFGISGDEPAGLRLFKRAHGLNFTLLSDENGAIAKRFGVPVREGGSIQRTLDEEEHTLNRTATTARWTFIIGLDGRIVYKDTEVDAGNDAGRVIEFLQNLS